MASKIEPVLNLELSDGMTGIVGSFSTRMTAPKKLLNQLLNSNLKDLTIIIMAISNEDDLISKMVEKGIVSRIITGFNNSNKVIDEMSQNGRLIVEFVPFGTLVEKIRLGGGGIPAFLSSVGQGSIYEENKEVFNLDGYEYIVEKTLTADFSLLKGMAADSNGNIKYCKSGKHLNHYAAIAASKTFVEVDECIDEFDVGEIETSSIYIDKYFVNKRPS